MSDLQFDGLDAHIAQVEGVVVAPMREAAGAGRPIDPMAYGLIGRAFAVTIGFAAVYASQSVGRLGDEAADFRERLVGTQDTYRQMERDNVAMFPEMPGAPR